MKPALAEPTPAQLRDILQESRTVAVVGLSPHEDRPSYKVAQYLKTHGYTIIPVNPGQAEILGEKAYASLAEIPVKVDVVDVFRRAEQVGPLVEEAIRIGARTIWLQEGIRNDEAGRAALAAGLRFVQDRCMMIEHKALR